MTDFDTADAAADEQPAPGADAGGALSSGGERSGAAPAGQTAGAGARAGGRAGGAGPTAGGPPAPAITGEHYRATLGHFCTGVTIVTAAGADGPAGFTCQSFSALSLEPPLVLVCPGRSSSSWPKIEGAGHFCVNVLAESQEELCRGFAMRGSDKFAGVGWTPAPFTGAPVLTGALAWIECTLESVHEAGDHVIAVGRVLDLKAEEGRPLLFFRGGYGRFDV